MMPEKSKQTNRLRIAERVQYEVWQRNPAEISVSRRTLVKLVRIACRIAYDLREGQLTLHAMSLVYTTLLSLIPLFAISFSVLKGFGVHREIEPFLITFLAPLGERADEIAARLVEFIENTSVSVLGYAGVALLFYAVVSLMQKVERAFNSVWHITRDRTVTERIRDYLALIIVGPTLMFAATGIWTSILHTDVMEQLIDTLPLGWFMNLVTGILPVLLIITAFVFIYMLVPNTKVRWRPALIGGVVAGLLWNLGGVAFAVFVGTSGKYPAIYSGLATAIFFMIWLYLAWMILLIGTSISFHVQNPTSVIRPGQLLRLSNRIREKLALAVAVLVGERFYKGQPPHSVASLSSALGLPVAAVDDVVRALEGQGLLVSAGEDAVAYLPARSWDTVSVRHLIEKIRTHGEGSGLNSVTLTDQAIEEVWSRFERTLGVSVDEVSLRELSERTES